MCSSDLVMDFGQDPAVRGIGNQFMYGPSLLVSPVTDFQARSRQLYLPAGTGWFNFYTGQYQSGGQTITEPAPLERMPLFVREGAILPFGPELQYADEKPADPITLYVYTGKDGQFTLYEDENVNYNYEKGAFATIPLSWNEQARTLTIGARKGTFPGMLASRTFNVVWVSKGKPAPVDFKRAADKTVTYAGQAVAVKME